MSVLSEIRESVAKMGDVVSSAIVLINGFKDRLAACGTNEEALNELKAAIEAEAEALAKAVAENTVAEAPAQPAAPAEPAPAELPLEPAPEAPAPEAPVAE